MQRISCFYLSRPIRGLAVAGCMLFLLFSIAHGADFTGDWNGYIVSNYDGSSLPISAQLYQYGSSLTGTVIIRMDEYGYPDLYIPFFGTANGNIVSGTASLSYPGILEFQLQIYGALSGNTINGTYNLYAYIEGEEFTDTGTFVLTRAITFEFISVAKSGTGSGTVSSSPPGIYCGTTCFASFSGGTTVTLTAAPDAGSYFVSWTGCDYVNGDICTVTVSYGRSIGAVFTASPSLAAADSNLYGDFGSNGIWRYNGTPNNWTKITPANPESMAASGSALYGDFGSNGIWRYNGTPNNWTKITPANPESMAASGFALYGDFGSNGIWRYNGTPNDWTKITPANPETMAAAGSDLHGDFGSNGIWRYNGTPNDWTKITPANPETMAAAGSDLHGDFGSNGIWRYNGTPNDWTKITPVNPESMVASDSILYCDFGSNGIWRYVGFAWEKIAVSNPTSMAAGSSALYGEYGVNGIWKYDGSWVQITQ